MDQEGDPCEVKQASLKPTTPTSDDPDSISPLGSDPEEELLTDEEIIESIYKSLFQTILLLRLQQCSDEPRCAEDYQTPLSRVTETVPGTVPELRCSSIRYGRTMVLDGAGGSFSESDIIFESE